LPESENLVHSATPGRKPHWELSSFGSTILRILFQATWHKPLHVGQGERCHSSENKLVLTCALSPFFGWGQSPWFSVVNGAHFEARTRPEPGPNPTFIFEARFRSRSQIWRGSYDMRNCRLSKNVVHGYSCRYTILSHSK